MHMCIFLIRSGYMCLYIHFITYYKQVRKGKISSLLGKKRMFNMDVKFELIGPNEFNQDNFVDYTNIK